MNAFGFATKAIGDEGMNAGDRATEVDALWVGTGETFGVEALLGPAAALTQSPGLNFVQKSRVGWLGRSAQGAIER
jgi:hypothetical protein